jgi:hypothetical protein
MTSSTAPPAAIRLRESFEGDGKPKGYKKTARFVDEATGETLYRCDIVGHVARCRIGFVDGADRPAFAMTPNRIVMPTEWRITDADGRPAGALVQKIFARGFWAGFDAGGTEHFRAVDPQKLGDKVAMQVLGGAVSRYALVAGDRHIGSVQEERHKAAAEGGVKGFLKGFVAATDPLLRLEPAAAAVVPRLFCGFMLLLYEITVPLDRST